MNYYTIETTGDLNDESLCYIAQPPEGMEGKEHRLALGKPAVKVFPDNARIRLREEHPGIKLPGFIGNRDGYLIFSAAGKTIIEKFSGQKNFEYFNFAIINHKNRVHSTDYFIINPLGNVDCLNEIASNVKYAADDGRVMTVPAIVLDPAKLAKAPHLFRVKHKRTAYVISEALVNELRSAGITNLICRPAPQTPKQQ